MYVYELATPADNKELLEILEEESFSGPISVLFTRRPDVMTSLSYEGDVAEIMICRDTINHKIALIGAFAINKCYIRGELKHVCYLFNLRLRKSYRGKTRVPYMGFKHLKLILDKYKIDFVFTTILEDNNYARRLLERKRKSLPTYHYLGNYYVYNFKSIKADSTSFKNFRRATVEDINKLSLFLTKEGAKNDFFPYIGSNFFNNPQIPGLDINNFFILLDDYQNICACGLLWDQREFKQYIIKGYSFFFKALSKIPAFVSITGYPPLPKMNIPIAVRTLSFWLVKDNNSKLFCDFLNKIRKSLNKYEALAVGIGGNHSLQRELLKTRHIEYKSRAYQVVWDDTNQELEKFDHFYFETSRM